MSKYILRKKLKLKPIVSLNKSAINKKQFIDESLGIFSLNNNDLNNPLGIQNNNITIDYLNHYSPTNRSPITLPPIPKNSQKYTNSQKKIGNVKVYNKFNSRKVSAKKIDDKNQNNKKNNESNLNIYINSEDKNDERKINNLKTIDSKNNNNNNKRDVYSLLFNLKDKNKNNNEYEKNLFINIKKNKNNNKIYPFYSPVPVNNKKNINNYKNLTNNSKFDRNSMDYIDTPLALSSDILCKNEVEKNNKKENKKKDSDEIKQNNKEDKNKAINNNSLPIINPKKSLNIINDTHKVSNVSSNRIVNNNSNSSIKEEKEQNNITQKKENINVSISRKKNNKDIDFTNETNIDLTLNFLKDLTTDKNNVFINFLILIQTHVDIELFFDSLQIINNLNSFRKKKQANNNIILISSNKLFDLKELINLYFNNLSKIYKKKDYSKINDNMEYPIDSFFLLPKLNDIFHRCFKVQVCLYSIILITLNQLSEYETNILLKNYLTQLLKQISFPLLVIYENFIKDEINLKYQELFSTFLKKDFNDRFKKLFQEKKIPSKSNETNSQLIERLANNLDSCINSLQYYSAVNIKNSDIKIFGDILNQMINIMEMKTLNQFVNIFLDNIIYCELEDNRNRALKANINNIYSTNSFVPFLPNIDKKYKYTLVLDMDETLIHFFFTKNIGMFFIRPFCFEFLYQLRQYYEIITFTAGTKEYADYILNLLDPNNELIKYRLYRQHVTILGCSVYKDLNKLGRDLSKVIIVDNMKDNFKMQPNNGLYVKTWINDINDHQFKDLMKILKDIVFFNVIDVRPIIEKINEEINRENNLINPYNKINIERIINELNPDHNIF